jgi:chromosome segregation ATPase
VVALLLLCVAQWWRDRYLNLDVNRLEGLRQAHEQKITEQDRTLRGLSADLAGFKEHFSAVQAELQETRARAEAAEKERDALADETARLKQNLTNWVDAVAVRDERLKEANERIRELAGQLNDSIKKFNELATNYNGLVTQVKAQQAAQTNTPAP